MFISLTSFSIIFFLQLQHMCICFANFKVNVYGVHVHLKIHSSIGQPILTRCPMDHIQGPPPTPPARRWWVPPPTGTEWVLPCRWRTLGATTLLYTLARPPIPLAQTSGPTSSMSSVSTCRRWVHVVSEYTFSVSTCGGEWDWSLRYNCVDET